MINSSFETDKAFPIGKADRWKPRFGNVDDIAGIETNPAHVYEGNQSASFSSSSPEVSYYYGPYNHAGNAAERIGVERGQVFELSAFSKVSPDFTGDGLRIAIIFWTDDVFHSRFNSPWLQSLDWTQEMLEAEVPEGANAMSYSIEYFGAGRGWFDKVSLRNQYARWYEKEAPLDVFEPLNYAGGDKVDYEVMEAHFYEMHQTMESQYNGNGTWGMGMPVGH